MKKILALLLLTFNLYAASSWSDKAHDLLPPPLKSFTLRKTSLSEVEKVLGKASLNEGQKYYWEREGFKYALELSFNNKFILETIHYTFTGEKPSLDKIGKIDVKKLTPKDKSGGKFFMLKEKDSEVTIDPVSRTIQTVKFL